MILNHKLNALNVPRGTIGGTPRRGEEMTESPGRKKYLERQKNLKRMRELKAQLRKFETAFGDEGNNSKMDDFCMAGIKKLRAEITELTTRV